MNISPESDSDAIDGLRHDLLTIIEKQGTPRGYAPRTTRQLNALLSLITERDALRKALDSVQADRARLDWMENSRSEVDWYRDDSSPVYEVRVDGPVTIYGETLRSVIDKARAAVAQADKSTEEKP